jgi:hypothetical protein
MTAPTSPAARPKPASRMVAGWSPEKSVRPTAAPAPPQTPRGFAVNSSRDYFRAPMQALLGLLRGARFAARARELGGLDVRDAGAIRWTP